MNRFINALLLFLLIPTMLIAIYIGFDLPVSFLRTTGEYIPYKFEILLGLGLAILLLNVRRSIRRWMGLFMILKLSKFKWNTPVNKERKSRIATYQILEGLTMLFLAFAFYKVTDQAWAPAIGFLVGFIDNVFFTIYGFARNGFRIGLTNKALIVADREVTVLYFSGLRKVSLHQQSVYFDYIKGLQLNFPINCINESERTEFFSLLEKQFDKNKVLVTRDLNNK